MDYGDIRRLPAVLTFRMRFCCAEKKFPHIIVTFRRAKSDTELKKYKKFF